MDWIFINCTFAGSHAPKRSWDPTMFKCLGRNKKRWGQIWFLGAKNRDDRKKSWKVMVQISLKSCFMFHRSSSVYTTWKVDGATPVYWFIMAPYKSGDRHLLSPPTKLSSLATPMLCPRYSPGVERAMSMWKNKDNVEQVPQLTESLRRWHTSNNIQHLKHSFRVSCCGKHLCFEQWLDIDVDISSIQNL